MRLTARESGGARKTRGGTRSGSAKTLAQHHRFRVWSTVKTCFPTLGHIASYKILEQYITNNRGERLRKLCWQRNHSPIAE